MSIDSDLKWVSSGSGPIYILSLIIDSCQILSIDIQITFHFYNKPNNLFESWELVIDLALIPYQSHQPTYEQTLARFFFLGEMTVDR